MILINTVKQYSQEPRILSASNKYIRVSILQRHIVSAMKISESLTKMSEVAIRVRPSDDRKTKIHSETIIRYFFRAGIVSWPLRQPFQHYLCILNIKVCLLFTMQ